MDQPAFTALSAIRTESDLDLTEIMLVNAKGDTRIIRLSPPAEGQLISELLTTTPGDAGKQPPIRPVYSKDAKPFMLKSGKVGIKFRIGPDAAIHIICLPGAIEALRACLACLDHAHNTPEVRH